MAFALAGIARYDFIGMGCLVVNRVTRAGEGPRINE